MELKHIKELMAVMQRTGTKRLVIKRDGVELELEREDKNQSKVIEPTVDLMEDNPMRQEIAMHRANMMLSRGGEIAASMNPTPVKAETEVQGTFVKSPMVGTFYVSPSPEDAAFVKVGDRIEKDTVVGIVEAMKVMNEIKAGVAGIVAEVLVPTGQPVEFATKLFRVT